MVDMQSATAEIRQGKKEEEERKKRDKNITSASATQGGHRQQQHQLFYGHYTCQPALKTGGCCAKFYCLCIISDGN